MLQEASGGQQSPLPTHYSALQWYWTIRSPGGMDASLEGPRGSEWSPSQEVRQDKEQANRANLTATHCRNFSPDVDAFVG